MSKEATAYIFSFDSKSGVFTLTSSKDQLIIDSKHKKYEWLKGQEAGRVIKISATGRWTSSKDSTGLYDKMLPSKKKSNKRKIKKTLRVRFKMVYFNVGSNSNYVCKFRNII